MYVKPPEGSCVYRESRRLLHYYSGTGTRRTCAYKLRITSGKAARESLFEQKIDELLKTGKFAEKGEDYWRRQLEYAEEEDVRGLKRSHPIEGERYQHE